MVFKIHVISHLGSLFSILSFSFLLVSTKVDIWSVKFSLAHGKADYIIFIIQEFNFIPWTLSQTPNMGTCCVIKKVVRSKNQVLIIYWDIESEILFYYLVLNFAIAKVRKLITTQIYYLKLYRCERHKIL